MRSQRVTRRPTRKRTTRTRSTTSPFPATRTMARVRTGRSRAGFVGGGLQFGVGVSAGGVERTLCSLPSKSLRSPRSITVSKTKHIIFENHPLILDGFGPPQIPSKEQMGLILNLFDGVFEVSISASFVVVQAMADYYQWNCPLLDNKPYRYRCRWKTRTNSSYLAHRGNIERELPIRRGFRNDRQVLCWGTEYCCIRNNVEWRVNSSYCP